MHSSTCIQVIKCITFVTVEAYVPVRNLFTFSLIVIVNWNAKKAHFETNDDFIKDYRLHSISHRFHCGLHCSPLLLNSSFSPTPAPPPPPPTPLIPAATLHMNRNTTENMEKGKMWTFEKKNIWNGCDRCCSDTVTMMLPWQHHYSNRNGWIQRL